MRMTHCEICGGKLKSWQKYTCSTECSTVRSRNQRVQEHKAVHIKPEPYIRKKHKYIETDADQARIKREIDERHSLGHCKGRVIEKGSEEWKEIVKTLTHIDRVPDQRRMPMLAPSKYRAGGIAA